MFQILIKARINNILLYIQNIQKTIFQAIRKSWEQSQQFKLLYKSAKMNKDLIADLDELDGSGDEDQMQDEQQFNQPQIGDEEDNSGQEVKRQQQPAVNIVAQKHSRLLTVNRANFLAHMARINKKIDQKLQMMSEDIKVEQDDKKQQITEEISKSNNYASQITKETIAITKYIKQVYQKKIPELESTINNDAFYCRALLQIEEPKQSIDEAKQIFSYLSPHQRISLRITISSPRDPLSKQDQKSVIEAAKIVIELQNHYEALMIYLETCMQVVAPNLCQLVGSTIASKLVATAGGIDKLAAMPACNIQVMGGSRSAQIGFSQMQRNHTGIFSQMDIVKDAPKKFQMQLVRMLATNTAKCARVDYLGTNKTQGAKLRDQMYERFQKIQQEGGLSRIEKPLEIPDMQPKKKRGGKRHRKNKELYEMSELRKNQNRVKFGQAQEQIEEGVGLGMLKAGTGRLKVNIKKQKLKVSKKMEQRANKKSGLQSTLNLSAHQGIQLINPALKQQRPSSSGTSSYFARQAGFRTIINSKLGK